MPTTRRPILGVMGGGSTSPEVERLAEEVGRLVAEWGAFLLCGGGSGVMEAAARGAKRASPPGTTIGILPRKEGEQAPNAFIDLPLFTGLRDARNYINVVTSDVLIALEGGAGTLSEIALGLKVGTPVVCLAHWRLLAEAGFGVHCVDRPSDAIKQAFALIGCARGSRLARPLRFPDFRSQDEQRARLFELVEHDDDDR